MNAQDVVFDQAGDFGANSAAEAWCEANGISVGSMQRGSPRGLMRGDYAIAKWRNLSKSDRLALAGEMVGNFREGPVVVHLWQVIDGAEATRPDEKSQGLGLPVGHKGQE